MSDNKKIYLDEAGYEEYLKEIRELEAKLAQIKKDKNSYGRSRINDGIQDNFEREQAARDLDGLSALIAQKKANIKNIVMVSKSDDDGLIDLGDYVCIELNLNDKVQTKVIRLTGSLTPKATEEVHEVTINSPLGKALYRKGVDDEFTYKVKEKNIKGVVRSRAKALEELNEKKNTVKR